MREGIRSFIDGWLVAVAVGAVGVVGLCGAKTVSQTDLGSLQSSQLGPVDEAQAALSSARQAKAQAQQRLQQAQSSLKVAQPGQQSAQASIDEAEARLAQAKQGGDPAAIAQAKQALKVANDYKVEERDRVAYLQREIDAADAELSATEKRIDLAKAKLEQSRLEALREAKSPAANKYQGWEFDKAVADRGRDYASAKSEADKAQAKAQRSFDAWQLSKNQVASEKGLEPARGGPGARPMPQGSPVEP